MTLNPVPRPEPRKRTKGRARRVESKVLQRVRAKVSERDGFCRLGDPALWPVFGECLGCWSQFAHLGAHRRFKTRGMAPEERHQTPGAIMLCESHHQAYDAHEIDIQPATSRGADGPLGFQCGATVYVEPDSRKA